MRTTSSTSQAIPLLLVPVLSLGACISRVYSPPARALPQQSAANLGSGQSGVDLEISGHSILFGTEMGILGGRFRHGVTERLELSAQAGLLVADTQDNDVSGRVSSGVKLPLDRAACRIGQPTLAVTAGLSMTALHDADSSTEAFGFGVGFQAPF